MRVERPAARITAATKGGRLLGMNDSFYPTRPDVLLKVEGLAALAAGCIAYQHLYPHHWGMFALLFLAPDISLLPYVRPTGRAAPAFYNALHCYVLPMVLGWFGWKAGSAVSGQVALIWIAHISFDRCLGYGLKFRQSFRFTHMQNAAGIAGD